MTESSEPQLVEIVPIIDPEWDQESDRMCQDREWLVKKACKRICEMTKQKINNYKDDLPDEIEFDWIDVRKDLLNFIENSKLPNKNTFDSVYDGGVKKKDKNKTIIDRQRFRDAGVVNPLVLDVKRKIANKCIKVWDMSDKKISNKSVWRITIFIHEMKKRGKKED